MLVIPKFNIADNLNKKYLSLEFQKDKKYQKDITKNYKSPMSKILSDSKYNHYNENITHINMLNDYLSFLESQKTNGKNKHYILVSHMTEYMFFYNLVFDKAEKMQGGIPDIGCHFHAMRLDKKTKKND